MSEVKSLKKWGLGWNAVGYLLMALIVLAFVFVGSKKPKEEESMVALINRLNSDNSLISVSQLTEMAMVANLAETARLPAETNAKNLAFSLILQHTMAMTGETATGGGAALTGELSRGITQYAVVDGDNLPAIAARFRITTQTIRWSNGLKNDDISVGQILLIPSIDGFVYTVKGGDSLEGLASRYQSSAQSISMYNDLETSGLREGMAIIIPDGVLPETERPEYVAPVYNPPAYSYSGGSSYGEVLQVYRNPYPFTANSYAYGWCTWYAAMRRAELGRPIGEHWGNASSWAWSAAAQGFAVGTTPAVGAVMANSGGYGGYGHVAIVESVDGDSITISEMNGVGGGLWIVDWRRVPMSTALSGYRYIY